MSAFSLLLTAFALTAFAHEPALQFLIFVRIQSFPTWHALVLHPFYNFVCLILRRIHYFFVVVIWHLSDFDVFFSDLTLEKMQRN